VSGTGETDDHDWADASVAFPGWPEEPLDFYDGVAADNSRTYWTRHKAVNEEQVRGPVAALLAELEPEYGAAWIFRPHRDIRFAADKSPGQIDIAAHAEGFPRATQPPSAWLDAHTGLSPAAPR
jgi:uncharacterized protein (DUF2461 family)